MAGKDKVERLRNQVYNGLTESHEPGLKGNDRDYWEEFDKAVSRWQRQVCEEFYLRAMMEVAVVAVEMRWSFRRLRTVYNLGSLE